MKRIRHLGWLTIAATGLWTAPATAAAIQTIKVTVSNLSPSKGTYITPVWVGFHDGTFTTFTPGAPASQGIERLAEDGDPGTISGDFTASGAGTTQGVLFGPVVPQIAPGQSTSMTFQLDPTDPLNRYFSFLSMVIPSNDAFIGNANPASRPIFDAAGNFVASNFIVLGSMVWDAGTEVNDEMPANTAFFGQASPNTGVTENGIVAIHSGYNPPGSGGILDDSMFANADFKAQGYQVASITFSQVPEPGTVWLLAVGLGLTRLYRRYRR